MSGGPASDSATLFKASNLSRVLAQARHALGGTALTVLKVEPRDVKIVGQTRTVTVDNTGKSLVINTPTIPGTGTFELSTVSPATVQSIVNAVEAKANLQQSDIGYVAVAVDPVTNQSFYGVYPRSGTVHYQADINGGGLKSYGGSSGAGAAPSAGTSSAGAPASTATSSGAAAPSGPAASGAGNAQSIATCISKAGTDAAKLAACSGG